MCLILKEPKINDQNCLASQEWCRAPIVPATWEAEIGGSLEPQEFEARLGNMGRSPQLKRKKQNRKLLSSPEYTCHKAQGHSMAVKELLSLTAGIRHIPLNVSWSRNSLVTSFLVLREFPFPEDLCLYIKPSYRKSSIFYLQAK
jgi:hypothetical protein